MRAVPIFLVVSGILSVILGQETAALNEKLNTIDTKPSVRLDPYIRKALLRALTELEEHENQPKESDSTEYSANHDTNSEILQTGHTITESLPTESSKEDIQIHSFVVNGQAVFENSSQNNSFLDTTTGNIDNQVTDTTPSTQSVFNEIFQTRESSNNIQQVRSIQKSTLSNTITDKETTTARATTTTTTTTTTPKPTHNDDGENIEEVNQRDVQVFQAPLVAAFTVHQDARGLPKKVVPIYQQQSTTTIPEPSSKVSAVPVNPVTPLTFNQNQNLPSVQNFNTNANLNAQQNSQPDYITQQIYLQKQLEEKQRILEEQLRLLQFQQRQQEDLLRKQQYLLQQKEAQRQQQIYLDQQKNQNNGVPNNFIQQATTFQNQIQQQNQAPPQNNRVLNNFIQQAPKFQNQIQHQNQVPLQNNGVPNNFVQQVPKFQNQIQHQNQVPNQNNGVRNQNSQISIQQSVSLDQSNFSNNINNQQQLPNREAVDFLLHLRSQQSNQFPLQENHLPQGISNFLQPGQFHQGPNINNVNDQFRQKQANRVFRQENGVGNFGLNNQQQQFNRFQQNGFSPIYQTNRFFPPNRQQNYNSDAELKHLLSQSGLSGRSHEDLNIVSKVLSLNHGVPFNNNIVSNRLPFDSRRQVRTL